MTYENETEESNARGTDLAVYVDQARAAGKACGKYVATLKTMREHDQRQLEREFIEAAKNSLK